MTTLRFAEASSITAPTTISPGVADMKARQTAKIQELGQALIDAGFRTLDAQADALGCRHQLMQKLQAFGHQLAAEEIDARGIAAGPGRLLTKPSATGSALTTKTIGVVVAVALTASAAGLPWAAIKATFRRISSAANPGRRSKCPSPQRYSIATFSPSEKPASFKPR